MGALAREEPGSMFRERACQYRSKRSLLVKRILAAKSSEWQCYMDGIQPLGTDNCADQDRKERGTADSDHAQYKGPGYRVHIKTLCLLDLRSA